MVMAQTLPPWAFVSEYGLVYLQLEINLVGRSDEDGESERHFFTPFTSLCTRGELVGGSLIATAIQRAIDAGFAVEIRPMSRALRELLHRNEANP